MTGVFKPIVGGTRRERVRAATVDEIKRTARRLLVEEGPASVSLRAIARDMGMTAPGLYRYFPSHEDLITALVADAYDELSAELAAARDQAWPATGEPAGGEVEMSVPVVRLVATARRFRSWAVENPRAFGLVFASPVPGIRDELNPAHAAGMRFGAVFIQVFLDVWAQRPFPVPDDAELPASLLGQLAVYREGLVAQVGPAAAAMPLGAIHVFLRLWVELYGLVAMEVFDHLHFCLTDVEPFFETHLQVMGRMIGINKVPPVTP